MLFDKDLSFWNVCISLSLEFSYFSQLHMPPSKTLRQDYFPHSGELFLLQKLEEVGNSVKVKSTIDFFICLLFNFVVMYAFVSNIDVYLMFTTESPELN